MATPFLMGLGVAGLAFGSRVALQIYKENKHLLPKVQDFATKMTASGYYRGGFEAQMSKREAFMILGLRDGMPKDKIKEAHRRVMLLNHPDRGGSPFLASKINEAKMLLDKQVRR